VTVSNLFSDSSSFKIAFGFSTSDITGASGFGVYIDNVKVVGQRRELPNLSYGQVPGSSGPITVSWHKGSVLSDTAFTGQPTYIDWAVQNNSSGAITCAFQAHLLLDGVPVKDTCFASGLAKDQLVSFLDTPVTVPLGSGGSHALRVEVDYSDRVD